MSFYTDVVQAGAVIDGASGFALVVLGFAVLAQARRRANLAFAVANIGIGTIAIVATRTLGIAALTQGYFAINLWVRLLSAPAAIALVVLVLVVPRPLPAGVRRKLVAWPAAATMVYAAISMVVSLSPEGGFFFVFAHGNEPFVIQAFSVYATILSSATLFALLFLPLRYRWAEVAGMPGDRAPIALMAVAIGVYAAIILGNRITFGAWDGWAGALGVIAACGLWLAVTARAPPGHRALPRNVALLTILAGATPALFQIMARLDPAHDWNGGFGISGASRVAMAIVLAYAILRHQLVDIDLRVKVGLQYGSVAAAFLGAYVLSSAAFTEALGPATAPYGGLAAVGVLAVAILPLQRMALRLADRLMPGVSATEGYLTDRKLQVYKASLEQILTRHPTTLGSAQAEALARQRAELGLTDRDHAILEHAVRAQLPGTEEGPLPPGALVAGKYRIERELGRGASGEVYLGRDEADGSLVAVKRLAGHMRREAAALARFQREARIAGALSHPAAVEVRGVETSGRDAFLVMEYMPGGSLEDKLRSQGPLPEAEVRALARDLLGALAAMHERGVLHRDIKPANVLFDAAGRAKLGDFSVARDTVSGETIAPGGSGGAVGTPAYMAPEQARGVAATPRSDLYGLAATMHAALTGKPPVDVLGLGEFEARLRAAEQRPRLPIPGVSPALNKVLARALAREPAKRYASAEAMRAALA